MILCADAPRMGLVNYALPHDQVLDSAEALAQELAYGPKRAMRWTKLSVNKAVKEKLDLIMDDRYRPEMSTYHSEDHREAVRAFVEKRRPRYTGRSL